MALENKNFIEKDELVQNDPMANAEKLGLKRPEVKAFLLLYRSIKRHANNDEKDGVKVNYESDLSKGHENSFDYRSYIKADGSIVIEYKNESMAPDNERVYGMNLSRKKALNYDTIVLSPSGELKLTEKYNSLRPGGEWVEAQSILNGSSGLNYVKKYSKVLHERLNFMIQKTKEEEQNSIMYKVSNALDNLKKKF